MENQQLGRSGLRISAMTVGTMEFGGGMFASVGSGDVKDARRPTDLALEAGVNLIDTADIYSMGKTEEIVGQALGSRRDDVILATKARFPMGDGVNDAGLSAIISSGPVRPACGGSAPDYIDLYQLHEWDGQTPLGKTLGALEHLLESGTVRYVGCSNFTGWQVMKALGIARAEGLPAFVSQQMYLSLQERSAEYEIVPSALDQGLGLLIWSPLAGGLLSGKYRRGQPAPEGSRHATDWDEPPVYDEDKLWGTVEALVEVAVEHGADGVQPSARPDAPDAAEALFTSSTPLRKGDPSRSEQHPPGLSAERPDRPGCTLTKPWSAESVSPKDDD